MSCLIEAIFQNFHRKMQYLIFLLNIPNCYNLLCGHQWFKVSLPIIRDMEHICIFRVPFGNIESVKLPLLD